MGDVPKAWLSFGEKWDFFRATKSGESNCWSSEMLAEVKMWTLSKILPTHLFHDPPLYCTWIIIFTLICLPHLLDIGVEKHKLTNSEPQNQLSPVHRGSFHETYLRWTVVLVAPLFGVIAAACSTGRMGTHTTMVTGHILALMSIVANIIFLRWVGAFLEGADSRIGNQHSCVSIGCWVEETWKNLACKFGNHNLRLSCTPISRNLYQPACFQLLPSRGAFQEI